MERSESRIEDDNFQGEDSYFDEQEVRGEPVISWKASEYIHHAKTTTWFIGFGVLIGVLGFGFYLLLRDISIVILVVVMAAALFRFATRKPSTLEYALTEDGILAGENSHLYSEFRSFSVMHDGTFYSIELSPLQRFKPPLSIFFDEKDGDQILDILSSVLPIEDKQPDIVDRLLKALRF